MHLQHVQWKGKRNCFGPTDPVTQNTDRQWKKAEKGEPLTE